MTAGQWLITPTAVTGQCQYTGTRSDTRDTMNPNVTVINKLYYPSLNNVINNCYNCSENQRTRSSLSLRHLMAIVIVLVVVYELLKLVYELLKLVYELLRHVSVSVGKCRECRTLLDTCRDLS